MSLGDLILELLRDIWETFLISIAGTGIFLFCCVCLMFLYGALCAVIYGLCWILYGVCHLILILPALARELFLDLRRNFTIPPRRFAWQSLKGFADARTSLLSEPDCSISLDTLTTSALCKECFRVVSQSKLISGSILPFARRAERHGWVLPLHVTELRENSCHLCRILWFTAAPEIRDRVITDIRQGKNLQAHLKIWRGESSDNGRYYIQVFYGEGQLDEHTKLSDPIPIQEGDLNGLQPSATVSMSTGSKDSIKLAKSWIEDCRNNHTHYCTTEASEVLKQVLPKRLLYVGDAMSSALHLVETRAVGLDLANIKYLALSYCRGDEISARETLTLDKEEGWKTHIKITSLPFTFQDAVHLTRQLGLSFLWIDVLCILQDDVDRVEWRTEMISVGSVYAHAYCTISACGSTNADGGCFHKRTPSLQEFPCYLRFSKSKGLAIKSSVDSFDKDSFSREVDKSALSQQAWALQARLLSPRILHFGSRFIFFECNTHIASETVPQGKPYRKENRELFRTLFRKHDEPEGLLVTDGSPSVYDPVDGYRAMSNLLRKENSTTLSEEAQMDAYWCWSLLLGNYTQANVHQGLDRSIAILGLAHQIATSESGLEYMHGLWSRHIILDLLWYIEPGRAERPQSKRSPTWSWQSVDGCVRHHLKMFTKEAQGKCYSILRVAELIDPAANDDRAESLPWLRTSKLLTLRCPVLRGSKARNKTSGPSSLEIQTAQQSACAHFWPDSVAFDESKEVFCTELIREVIYEKKDKKRLSIVWSNGLVLQRTLKRGSSGVKATYTRVGRFWMEWPVDVNHEAGKSGKNVKPMFDKNKKQEVRII